MACRLAYPLLCALGLTLGLAGCKWPEESGPNLLPDLVTIYGQAMLPDDYVVQANTQPAPRTFRTMLARMDGMALATGAITDEHGNFSLNVPTSSLGDQGALYEVALIDPSRGLVFRSLVKLSSATQQTSLKVDATTTTIALAAHEAVQQGKDPMQWDLSALGQNVTLQSHCLQYSREIAMWSNSTSGITSAQSSTPPSPVASLLSEVLQDAAH